MIGVLIGAHRQAVDRLVVTPQGEAPPILGEAFPESDADRKVRRKAAFFGEGAVDTTSTVSFSFHTMFDQPGHALSHSDSDEIPSDNL